MAFGGDSAVRRSAVTRSLDRVGLRERTAFSVTLTPLVQYALAVVLLEAVALQVYNVAVGRTVVFVDNPLWLIRPVVLLGAAHATSLMHRRYRRAIRRSLVRRASDTTAFDGLVPARLCWAVVGVGVAFTLVNATVLLGLDQIHAAGGPVRVFRFLVVIPFGYVPVLGTFLATYLSVQVVLPRRLERAGVRLDFLDPEDLGGMRPIGELIKYSYYFLMVGLTGYAVAVYGPYVLRGPLGYTGLSPPGLAVNVLFTAVWAGSVVVMVYGIYVLHRYMSEQKREEIHRLTKGVEAELDESWELAEMDVANPPAAYERYRAQVDYVTSMGEYPATFTLWTQLVVGVMVPKAIQMALSAL